MQYEMEEYLDDGSMVLGPREQFDKCIIGVTYQGDKVIYSVEMIIQTLMEENEMSDEEALDYFEYNVIGSYVGYGTPIYMG